MARGRPGAAAASLGGDERTALGLGLTLFTAQPRDCRHVLLWVESPKNTWAVELQNFGACLVDALMRLRASWDALLDPLAKCVEIEGSRHPVALS